MKQKYLILLFIFAVLLTVAAVASFYSFYVIKEIRILEMTVKVADYVGINIDTDKVYFGAVMPGGASIRSVKIWQNYTTPLRVKIFTQGYITNWVENSNSSFILQPNQTATIPFTVHVPKGTAFGNYTGKIKIVMTRW